VLVSLEAVFLEDSMYKSPPEALLFSIGDVEREREMICTLKSDFKIQKSREIMEFQKSNGTRDVL